MWRQFVNIVKKAFFVRLACIVLALGMAIPAWTTGNKIRTVVIDPGHGGKDPGAVGSAGHEKDIVLAIGLKLGAYIRESFPDVKIVFTRDTDVFIPLHERAGLANKHDADLFISIHANANTKPEIDGTETYVMGMHKTESNLEVAKLENSVIFLEEDHSENYEGFDPNSSESYIIFELIQSIYMRQSLHLANNIQDQFRDRVQRKDRGVKQAGFLVLWQTAMPSVLVETGYITNRDEEKFMLSENGQDYLASAIFRAFRDYKTKLESSSVILPDKITDNQPTTNTPADTAKHSGTDLAAKYPATESNLIFSGYSLPRRNKLSLRTRNILRASKGSFAFVQATDTNIPPANIPVTNPAKPVVRKSRKFSPEPL